MFSHIGVCDVKTARFILVTKECGVNRKIESRVNFEKDTVGCIIEVIGQMLTVAIAYLIEGKGDIEWTNIKL